MSPLASRLRVLTLAAVASLPSFAAADDPPKPPSTGKELAATAPGPADEQAAFARGVLKRGSCAGQVAKFATALNLGDDKMTKAELISGHLLLQDCAASEHAHHAVIQAGVYLLSNAADKANASHLVDAEIALGDETAARSLMDMIGKRWPAQKANLTASESMIACHTFDFARCFAASAKMLDFLRSSKTGTTQTEYPNHMFHGLSAAALGKYDAYEKDIGWLSAKAKEAGENPAMWDAVKTVIDHQRQIQMFVQVTGSPELALGTYHLFASGAVKNELDGANSLVTLRIVNQQKKPRSVKVTVEIPGVTELGTKTVALTPGVQENVKLSPPLKIDFDVAKIRAARAGQVAVKVTDAATGTVLYDNTQPIQVLPRDSLPLFRKIGGDDVRDTLEYSAAWITPNAPEVDAFIKRAKARLGDGDSFSGEQQTTMPQVKALFDELKAHGVSYVSDPEVFSESAHVQRTRLPAEVLASTNAQCLEGTLLYATLLEAIGLDPVMVFISGHVFVGWRPSKYDKTAHPLFVLETTMTGGKASFEQASAVAEHELVEQIETKQFDIGNAHVVDIRKLRKAGYTPQPY